MPILDKETLRKLDDREFYESFCLTPDDGIAEYWRSGGSTGTPLFYPRSYDDIDAAMVGFARIYDCTRCRRGGRAHVSFPLGIHPVGQMLARAASSRGIAVNWAGSGTTTPSVLQLELIDRLQADHLDGHEQLRPASRQSRRSARPRSRLALGRDRAVLGRAAVGCKTR